MEAFSLQKVVNMFEEVMVRGQVNVGEEAKLYRPTHSAFEELDVRHVVGHCYGEELTHYIDQLQFLVHLTNLLSILLRCNGFTRIQTAVVDQKGSRPPNSDHDLFLVQD